MIVVNHGTQARHMLKMIWFLAMGNVGNLPPREEVLNHDPGYKMEMTFGKNVRTKRTQLLLLINPKLHPDGNGCYSCLAFVRTSISSFTHTHTS